MFENLINYMTMAIEALPRRLFRMLFPEKIKPSDYDWTPYNPIFQPAIRLIDGRWAKEGQLWRRRRPSDDKWEYRQDDETDEEQMNRIA